MKIQARKLSPGPMPNPYSGSDPRWSSQSANDKLFLPAPLLYPGSAIYETTGNVIEKIFRLLERIYIEAVAYHRWGLDRAITRWQLNDYKKSAPFIEVNTLGELDAL